MALWICGEGCEQNVTQKTGHPGACKPHARTFYNPRALGSKPRKAMRQVSEKRQAEEDSGARPRRRNGLDPGKGFAVDAKQREKIKGLVCVYCGVDPYEGGLIDPAHLIPRSVVSCEHPEGVIPLCRRCHDAYDVPSGGLDLLAKQEDRGYHAEMGHFIADHQVNPLTLLRYVTGMEYVPKLDQPPQQEAVGASREGDA